MPETQPDAGRAPGPGDDHVQGLHYVLTLHGIRTKGAWQENLGELLKQQSPSTRVEHFKYGVFSLFSYVIPFLRWINVWRFRRYLEDLARRHPGARIDIVAHSFGTYIAGHSLAKVCPKVGLRVNTVILAGSVLKVWFPWKGLIDKGFVGRLVNECGTQDNVLLGSQLFVLLTGMAGRIGFSGVLGDSFKNRFYKFGHSGYFEPSGDEGTEEERRLAFMRKQWVPLLMTDAPIDDHDETRTSILTPTEHFLLQNADPIKLLAYGAILSALIWVPAHYIAMAQAKAEFAQTQADKIAKTAFSSMQAFGNVVASDPNLQRRADLSQTRKRLLEEASKLFGDLVEDYKDSPELPTETRLEVARAYIEIARLASDIGGLNTKSVDVAIDNFEIAVHILEQLDSGDPKTRWALANALGGLGDGYLNRQKINGAGDPSLAREALQRARDILQDLDPGRVPKGDGDLRRLMARTLIDLGVLDTSTNYKEASNYLEALRKSSEGSMPEIELGDEYGWLSINLGGLEADAGHLEAAKVQLVQARKIFDQLANAAGEPVPPPLTESLAWSLHDLGRVEVRTLRVESDPKAKDAALNDLLLAADKFRDLVKKFDDRDSYKIGLASTLKDRGEAIRSLYGHDDIARREKARIDLAEALDIYSKKLSTEKRGDYDVLRTRSWVEHNLGWVLLDLFAANRNTPTAKASIFDAVDHLEEAYNAERNAPEFGLGYGWGLIKLGEWHLANPDRAEAKRNFEKARKKFEDVQTGRPRDDQNYRSASEGLDSCKKALDTLRQSGKAALRARPGIKRVAFQAPPEVKIDLGRAVVVVRPTGTVEPPVPVFRDGKPLKLDPGGEPARFKIIEIYENASTRQDFPLIWSDLVSIGYFRSTYQKPDGPGARMGTSVVGSPSFRPAKSLLKLIPEITRADVTVGGVDRLRVGLSGRYGTQADVALVRTYPPPAVGRSTTNLTVKFVARERISLDHDQRGFDAFRLVTLSSMFASNDQFDANVLRYEDRGGNVQTLRLDRSTRRDAHLLPRGVELGGWFELIKTSGSRWFPDSPSIRVEIPDRSKISARLGLQGYLAGTVDPNDDSLSVWVEWLDAPELLAPGTTIELSARVIATPPL
jgi:hypothetical protein